MYVGTTPTFTTETAIASFQFDKLPDGHQLGLLESKMQELQSQAKGKYLYLRFQCSQATTVRPTLWTPSDCMSQAVRIQPKEEVSIAARSKVHYGLFYADIQGGDMTIRWQCETNNDCPFFLGDSCIKASDEDTHVFYNNTIAPNQQQSFTKDEVADWADHVDGDGYIYARFNPNKTGTIIITTSADDHSCQLLERTRRHQH